MRRFAPTGNTRRSAPIGARVSGTRGRVRPEQAPESSGMRIHVGNRLRVGRRVARSSDSAPTQTPEGGAAPESEEPSGAEASSSTLPSTAYGTAGTAPP